MSSVGMLAFGVGSLFLVLPLAALELPAWLSTALATSPIALTLLGLTIQEEAGRPWVFRLGNRLERAGGWIYVALWFVALGVGTATKTGESLAGILGSAVGLPVVWGIGQSADARARGELPEVDDPFAHGAALVSQGGLGAKGLISILGVDTLGMGAISFAFTAVATWLIAEKGPNVQAWTTLLFFGGCSAVAVQTALMRWATFVPGRHRRTVALARAAAAVGMSSMLVALFGFALYWPDVPLLLRVLFGVAGVAAVGALAVAGVRRVLGRRVGTVTFVREGLAVTDRRGPVVWRWNDVVGIHMVDVSGNLAVGVDLSPDAEPLLRDADGTAAALDKRLHKLSTARGWCQTMHGADLVFLAIHMPEPPREWLERALMLVDDPSARAALPEEPH